MAEKGARASFREESVEEPTTALLAEDLEEVVVLTEEG